MRLKRYATSEENTCILETFSSQKNTIPLEVPSAKTLSRTGKTRWPHLLMKSDIGTMNRKYHYSVEGHLSTGFYDHG